jgi:hypothetical protein
VSVTVLRRTRYVRAVAGAFERELEAARNAYERNDPYGALRRLDRARKSALERKNLELLGRVLDFAEGVIARDERTEIERENVIYAARQNVRQVLRRRAWETGGDVLDPFPGLDAPRPATRTFISTGVKVWIGVGVALGTALVLLWLLAPAFS